VQNALVISFEGVIGIWVDNSDDKKDG